MFIHQEFNLLRGENVFEAKVLEEKNVAFWYAVRILPNYINGYTLTTAVASHF